MVLWWVRKRCCGKELLLFRWRVRERGFLGRRRTSGLSGGCRRLLRLVRRELRWRRGGKFGWSRWLRGRWECGRGWEKGDRRGIESGLEQSL